VATKQYDVLVLGTGIAGLSFALKAASLGRVAMVTKKASAESNTNYAQGGIAAVLGSDDTFELHVGDTLEAGAGMCHEDIVRLVIREGPARIQELTDYGMRFTHREKAEAGGVNDLDLGREGGHSRRRIVHSRDMTGREAERVLLDAASANPAIDIFEDHIAVDLITTAKLDRPGPNRCAGAYVLNRRTGVVETYGARVTMLATGGCGKVYLYTTNPDIATGDGVAMAYRAGAAVVDMEFVQFHPTCLFHPKAKSFLISEAVRGEGGILRTMEGHAFMEAHHAMKDLAPRDVVARAIDSEMKQSGSEHVWLDITHRPAPFTMERFPNIYRTCLGYGIDITKEPIPVVPAAHYQCGGVRTSVDGDTDIPGLMAVGEAAWTGLHGANRLASNSLLEALVGAHRAVGRLASGPLPELEPDLPVWESGQATNADELVVVSHNWDEIRRLMWDYVGIVRTTKRLRRALTRATNLLKEIDQYYWDFLVTSDLLELRNIATVAELIIRSALQRPESRGLHYTLDYTQADPAWAQRDTVLQRES